jgi:plastocyanin
MPTRRHVLIGAACVLAPRLARGAEAAVEIAMAGRGGGAHVWFDPIGVLVRPGQPVRWTNREKGNVHTATAYHPANFDRPLRIPDTASPWDSDYLMPGDSFEVVLTEPGVYDYYCVPHEHAGMVGRLVVGEVGGDGGRRPGGDLPPIALAAFPPVETILRQGRVAAAVR